MTELRSSNPSPSTMQVSLFHPICWFPPAGAEPGAWGAASRAGRKEESRRLLKLALLLPAVIEVRSIFLY
jgi:hypothetical protein